VTPGIGIGIAIGFVCKVENIFQTYLQISDSDSDADTGMLPAINNTPQQLRACAKISLHSGASAGRADAKAA